MTSKSSHELCGACTVTRTVSSAQVLQRLQVLRQPAHSHRNPLRILTLYDRVFLVDGNQPDDDRQQDGKQQCA